MLDLKELCEEFEELDKKRFGCDRCDGVGYLFRGRWFVQCAKCGGEGNLEPIVQSFKNPEPGRLDADEFELWKELRELAGEIANIQPDQVDVSDFQLAIRHNSTARPISEKADWAREYWDGSAGGIDIGNWPFNCIDWEKAADKLMEGVYSIREFEFEGIDYFFEAQS